MAKPRLGVMDPLAGLSDDSDSDDSENSEGNDEKAEGLDNKDQAWRKKARCDAKAPVGKDGRSSDEPKKGALAYEALKAHGYTGGPSVLFVPPPAPIEQEQNWGWGKGQPKPREPEEESLEERERTRELLERASTQGVTEALAVREAAEKLRVEAAKERRAQSFNQKEKRKRDLGQASRGKNYVEEEKRLLRDQGVYSGFDA